MTKRRVISGGDARCTEVREQSAGKVQVWLNEATGVMEPFVDYRDAQTPGLADLRVFGAEYQVKPRRKRRLTPLQSRVLFVVAVTLLASSGSYLLTWWLFR